MVKATEPFAGVARSHQSLIRNGPVSVDFASATYAHATSWLLLAEYLDWYARCMKQDVVADIEQSYLELWWEAPTRKPSVDLFS